MQLDQQDLHRYCQYSLHEQVSECLYHIYRNLSFEKIKLLLLIERQDTRFYQVILPCDDNPELYQFLISLYFRNRPICYHYQKFNIFKKSQKVT